MLKFLLFLSPSFSLFLSLLYARVFVSLVKVNKHNIILTEHKTNIFIMPSCESVLYSYTLHIVIVVYTVVVIVDIFKIKTSKMYVTLNSLWYRDPGRYNFNYIYIFLSMDIFVCPQNWSTYKWQKVACTCVWCRRHLENLTSVNFYRLDALVLYIDVQNLPFIHKYIHTRYCIHLNLFILLFCWIAFNAFDWCWQWRKCCIIWITTIMGEPFVLFLDT